eukprot:SAG11_NODE_13572_length_649_cov_0.821818_1_plen_42_part_10
MSYYMYTDSKLLIVAESTTGTPSTRVPQLTHTMLQPKRIGIH